MHILPEVSPQPAIASYIVPKVDTQVNGFLIVKPFVHTSFEVQLVEFVQTANDGS
jgi:hypothetical protein